MLSYRILNPGILLLVVCGLSFSLNAQNNGGLQINDQEYFERPGLNVMIYHDYYPVGHQSGITIIQNGNRIAANGDLRLWPMDRPFPDHGNRMIDKNTNTIAVDVFYNDSLRKEYTDNRYPYPNLDILATVIVKGEGDFFRISVDLDKPLPGDWSGKLGFSLELFPGDLFESPYYMDGNPGTFPRSMNGNLVKENDKLIRIEPLASGSKFVIHPDKSDQMVTIESKGEPLELVDGRVMRNNGWYILRSPVKTGLTKDVVEWIVQVASRTNYVYEPVIQVSQVGYFPSQEKVAVIELDKRSDELQNVHLIRIDESGIAQTVKTGTPRLWGDFLRYRYAHFDFSEVSEPGIYRIKYGEEVSNNFLISESVYTTQVWQPTLAYYLPVQMCHMRINDRVKVWHGLCHDDDALMAPVSHIHFDGYRQGSTTLTDFEPGDAVPGLNTGGWHDAGDYDLRVESQANTVRTLSFAWELFHPEYDVTTVLPEAKIVEMNVPDGIPDILQQIEHGVRTIAGGYHALGRLYRGIICPTGRQYSLLGDGSVMTDNLIYDPDLSQIEKSGSHSGVFDDRWVFTEENPRRELDVASCLATAFRSLEGYNDDLAEDALMIAQDLWEKHQNSENPGLIDLASELFQSTEDQQYLNYILSHRDQLVEHIERVAPAIARVASHAGKDQFGGEIRDALTKYSQEVEQQISQTPYGVRYRPNIWGDGWNIQRFAVNHYFLHRAFPDVFPAAPIFNTLNFVLGVHPGENTASFVSAVGANSLLVAYGVNRDDWSYIPGGVASGTALIRPDLPELKVWPYFWQQTEYVMGGGATHFMFLVLACNDLMQ